MSRLRFWFSRRVKKPLSRRVKKPLSKRFARVLRRILIDKGHEENKNNPDVVFEFSGPEESAWMIRDAVNDPRKQKPIAVVEYDTSLRKMLKDKTIEKIWNLWDAGRRYVDEYLAVTYPVLVRNLVPEAVVLFQGRPQEIVCVGMEGSCVRQKFDRSGDVLGTLWENVIEPRVRSQLMLDYVASDDLSQEVCQGTEETGQLRIALDQLSSLGLLPPPFPFAQALAILEGEEESSLKSRYLKSALEISGVSYGMASMANRHPALPEDSFWVSASGVSKDFLPKVAQGGSQLVVGWEREGVPKIWRAPGSGLRPSVETFENLKVRECLKEVRNDLVWDILHTHGWIRGVPQGVAFGVSKAGASCGSRELAEDMSARAVEILRDFPSDSEKIVIVLNQIRHGFTILAGTRREDLKTGMAIILDLLIRGSRKDGNGILFINRAPQVISLEDKDW